MFCLGDSGRFPCSDGCWSESVSPSDRHYPVPCLYDSSETGLWVLELRWTPVPTQSSRPCRGRTRSRVCRVLTHVCLGYHPSCRWCHSTSVFSFVLLLERCRVRVPTRAPLSVSVCPPHCPDGTFLLHGRCHFGLGRGRVTEYTKLTQGWV